MTPIQEPAEQLAPGQKLCATIEAAIVDSGGWIGFDRYMQMALYTPGLGYYSGSLAKFGAAGDFITAPEMGDLFGRCLATQVAETLQYSGGGSVLEFGAGSGALAASVLKELDAMEVLPGEYLILELSGELRARQQETIKKYAGELYSCVKWLDRLPSSFQGVVIANEVLDAMPFKVFEQQHSGAVMECGVSLSEASEALFRWQTRAADEELKAAVNALNISLESEAYRSEISPQAGAWLASLGEIVTQGLVLLVDYGFPQAEYYHPDRDRGTLMCHYRHRAHDDPFFKPGLQDITAHVDFSAIARAGLEAGFDVAGYTNQASFLLSNGLLEKIPLDAATKEQLELAQQVKKLTLPHEMGELFKVLALGKGLTQAPRGFQHKNLANRL